MNPCIKLLTMLVLFVAGLLGSPASAATMEELSRWKGCYEFSMSAWTTGTKKAKHPPQKPWRARLTDVRIEYTGGTYVIEKVDPADEFEYFKLSGWWPIDERHVHIDWSDGYRSFSMNLQRDGERLTGITKYGSDTGAHVGKANVSATTVTCP